MASKEQKMNSEQALTQVEEAIKNRPASDTGRWYLTFTYHAFTLQPTHTEPAVWPIIATLTENEITHGLTNNAWALIKTRIAKLIIIGSHI